jgi:hypothetical protein
MSAGIPDVVQLLAVDYRIEPWFEDRPSPSFAVHFETGAYRFDRTLNGLAHVERRLVGQNRQASNARLVADPPEHADGLDW